MGGDSPHLAVFGKATDAEVMDAAVAGGADDAAHQLGADAVLLQRLLDRERGFCLATPRITQLFQLGGGANLGAIEVSVDNAAHVGHAGSVVLDEHIGDAVGDPQAAARLVETQQMIAKSRHSDGQSFRMSPCSAIGSLVCRSSMGPSAFQPVLPSASTVRTTSPPLEIRERRRL